MNRYISLINWTDQGVRAFRDTVDRADTAAAVFKSAGGSMVEIYWLLGPYDIAIICDFPDDETATAALLQVSSVGNVRTTTMRAFDRDAARSIISKTGS
jgi:uncharacterized protein with GYD domain